MRRGHNTFAERILMSFDEIVATMQRFKEAGDRRRASGRLIATELRLHDADQVSVLMEHVERGCPSPVASLMGIPVRCDDTVPVGAARLILEDGTTRDYRMT